MKVKDVKLQVVRRQVPKGRMNIQFGEFGGEVEMGVLRILAEDGLEGNAFVGSYIGGGHRLFDPIISVLKPEVVGMDVADREWLWSRFWTHHGQMAYRMRIPTAPWAFVDVALWDLAGKAAGMPIYHMLGAQRHKVRAYASSPYYPEIERYVAEAREYVSRGFKAYKIHPGEGDPRRIQELARRVREAVGPDVDLMMDCAQMLSYKDALAVGRTLEELNFFWFEDPVRFTDIDAMVELTRRLDIRITVSDHHDFRFFEVVPILQRGAARIIRSEAPKLGITGLKKLAGVCEAFGVDCEIHHGTNSLMNAANLHVMLSIANCDYYEWLLPPEAHQFGVVRDIAVDGEGYVHAPEGPGLGFDIDWELVNRHTVGVLE